MKIIKQLSDNVVLFVGDDLVLDAVGCGGTGWSFRNVDPSGLVLDDAAEIPVGFIGGGWSYTGGIWAMNSIGEQALLPEKRAKKIAELEAIRLAIEYSDVAYVEQMWSADAQSRALLAQVLAPGSIRENAYWRDATGTKHTMTYADLQGLGRAISDRGYDADETLETRKAAVAAAATAAEIDAITW